MPNDQTQNARTVPVAAQLFLLLLWITGAPAITAATEEPKYTLLETLEDVEIRRYEPTIQAYTSMNSGGFRNLAGYIFGGNSGSEEIAMTAPVATTVGNASPEMAFTTPATWSMETLPSPDDETVRLREMPAFTAAVIEFSGWASRGSYTKQLEKLSQQLQQHGLSAVGEPILNQYDPPWKPPFLRRNEVMIAIEWPVQQSSVATQPGS